jgi:hypothetical protein
MALRQLKCRLGCANLLLESSPEGSKARISTQQLNAVRVCVANFIAEFVKDQPDELEMNLLVMTEAVPWHANDLDAAMAAVHSAFSSEAPRTRMSGKCGAWAMQDYEAFPCYFTDAQWNVLIDNRKNLVHCQDMAINNKP